MFQRIRNLFRKKRVTGSAAIHAAIGQFEDIAARLIAAATDNHVDIAANSTQIAELKAENEALATHATRAVSVAEKLRALIS